MGPNFRKLLYSAGLTAAGVGVTVGGAAGLAHIGVNLDPTLMTATVSAVASLLGGVGGNLGHEVLNAADERLWDGVSSRALEIDENHHILLQLRRSYLRALRKLAQDFAGEAYGEADMAFLDGLENYLTEARMPDRLLPQSEVTTEEKRSFAALSQALQAGLAERGAIATQEVARRASSAKMELLYAAMAEIAVEVRLDCPQTFLSLALREESGFVDLFVRDAAGALKDNHAFSRIWDAEQQQQILSAVGDLQVQLQKGLADLHDRFTTMEERLLTAIAATKGVPIERLRPILEKLGKTDVPEDQYEQTLSLAVDELLARSREHVLPSNMGPEVDMAIAAARKKLADLDTIGARGVLVDAIREQRAHRQAVERGEAALLREKAQIEQSSFDYDAAVADWSEAQRLAPDYLRGWRQLGQLHLRLGHVSRAGAAFDRLLEQAQASSDTWWQMTACNEIGDVRRQTGDLPGALARFTQGQEIAEQLAAANPRKAQAQRDLSVSYSKIGNVRLQTGDVQGALESFTKDLEIAERLAAADPRDAQAQRDLSVSHEKIGDVRRQTGDVQGALESFTRSLEISERLAATDPRDAQAQRDLSISYERIGDVRRQTGELQEALESFTKGHEIRERLAAADPRDAQAQRDLSISHNKIGDVRLQTGDMRAALESFTKSLEIRERLAAPDPRDARAQRDLLVSYWKLAVIDDSCAGWQKVVTQMDAIKGKGQFLPMDEPFYEQALGHVRRTCGDVPG